MTITALQTSQRDVRRRVRRTVMLRRLRVEYASQNGADVPLPRRRLR